MAQQARRRSTTLVVMGASGSGKSEVMAALAGELGWATAEGDTFHSAANVGKMRSGRPLTDADRRPWLGAIAAWIGEREAAGQDAIVTCSALKRRYRDVLRAGHPSVWFVHLDPPRDVLAQRLAGRKGHYMPASLLDSQLAALEPVGPDEPGFTLPGTEGPRATAAAIVRQLPPPISHAGDSASTG